MHDDDGAFGGASLRFLLAKIGKRLDEEDRAHDRHEKLVEPDRLVDERLDERLSKRVIGPIANSHRFDDEVGIALAGRPELEVPVPCVLGRGQIRKPD